MEWNYKLFEEKIIEYFKNKEWEYCEHDNMLKKGFNPEFPQNKKMKFLMDDSYFYKRIKMLFDESSFAPAIMNSLKNEQDDTDLIIAGYQVVANQFDLSQDLKKTSLYLFQPVVRLNEIENCGVSEGFLSSFVNICLIDVNTTFEEYLKHVDWWITILSRLSLHVSGIKLRIKNKTTAFYGYGIEFLYKGIEIGQANLYLTRNKYGDYLISDFGFGYERLLWILNNGRNFFSPVLYKYDIVLDEKLASDKIRTAVLLIGSGILPSSSGVGKSVKKLINMSCVVNNDRFIELRLRYYYDYYSRFIKMKYTYEQVKKIYISEVNTNILKCLFNVKNVSRENITNKILMEEIEKLYLKL